MNVFLNPCRCQCEKEVTKSELIVVMKRNSLQKNDPNYMINSQSKASTIALEPRQIDIRRQSIFLSKKQQQLDFNDLECFLSDPILKSSENLTQKSECKIFQRSSETQTTKLLKPKQVETSFKDSSNSHHINQKNLKEKIMNGQVQEETQRKTMKKHNFRPKQIKDQAKDLLLTTKRCKKQYNGASPSPQENKENTTGIQQGLIHKLLRDKGRQIGPKNVHKNIENKNYQNQDENSMKFISEQIEVLRMQLKRLEDDEERLIKERDQNQRFFNEDFAINEKKKQNLKKNCQERFSEIKDLKKLLMECKNRGH